MTGKTTAYVLLAGGSGSRLGAHVPKQFIRVAGKTVLEHSHACIAGFAPEARIIVTVPADSLAFVRDLLVGVTDSSVRVLDSLPAREEDDPLEELLELEGPPEGADPRERLALPIPTGSTDRATDVPGLEHLRSPRTATGRQPRMNLFDALKEMTVRRH